MTPPKDIELITSTCEKALMKLLDEPINDTTKGKAQTIVNRVIADAEAAGLIKPKAFKVDPVFDRENRSIGAIVSWGHN